MNALTLFGLFAVTAMLITYALETRSHWFILAFAASCVLGSIYGFLQGAWPFGAVEAVWACVAFTRWWKFKKSNWGITREHSPHHSAMDDESGPPNSRR
jgi:hypothetical protein